MKKGENYRQVGTEGLELFARRTDPETSHQAARSMREHAQDQRNAILVCLGATPEGATADKLDKLLGWDRSTAGRRLGELLRDDISTRSDGLSHVVRLDGGYVTHEGRMREVQAVQRSTRGNRPAWVHISRDYLDRWLVPL